MAPSRSGPQSWVGPPSRLGSEQQWLQVSEEEQSRNLVKAFEQAIQEWPWLERIAVWNLSAGLPVGDERRGYSILAGDGTPKPAYGALAAWQRIGESRNRGPGRHQGPEAPGVEILAPDVVVRLSDVDTFYPHWARPQCKSVPCRRWIGEFYLGSRALPPGSST